MRAAEMTSSPRTPHDELCRLLEDIDWPVAMNSASAADIDLRCKHAAIAIRQLEARITTQADTIFQLECEATAKNARVMGDIVTTPGARSGPHTDRQNHDLPPHTRNVPPPAIRSPNATSRQLDSLTSAFARAINGHSAENVSNTPDMILAAFAGACLDAFNAATQERERWYGRDKDFNAAPQTAAADTMDRSAVDETPRPEGSPKRAHSGESATAAPLTEQDIKRFRVGDILFNDEQARMFCDLAMKGLRAEGAIKTLPDASLLVQRFETALQIAVTADLTPGGVSKAREKAVWDNADEKRGDLLKALTPSATSLTERDAAFLAWFERTAPQTLIGWWQTFEADEASARWQQETRT